MFDRRFSFRRHGLAVAWVAAVVLAGCASPKYRAPVEDRSLGSPRVAAPVPAASAPAAAEVSGPAVTSPVAPSAGAVAGAVGPGAAEAPKPPPRGIENLGKPGYYAVKPGDTLVRIALDAGQNWKDLVRWNNLDNPNVIEVGQVLRVVPPATEAGAVTPRPPEPVARAAPSVSAPTANAGGAAAAAPTPPAAAGDEDVRWAWPASGPVLGGFDEGRTKGMAIGGRAGDPVLAAADGRVVYSGSGLRGYGNLVILKHNNTFLSAYAHNQSLLVKEDQMVRRGQKIAEMGSSDAERVQLHFEIRRQGRPVDPGKLLPPR